MIRIGAREHLVHFLFDVCNRWSRLGGEAPQRGQTVRHQDGQLILGYVTTLVEVVELKDERRLLVERAMANEGQRSDELVLINDFVLVQVKVMENVLDFFFLAFEQSLQVVSLERVGLLRELESLLETANVAWMEIGEPSVQ